MARRVASPSDGGGFASGLSERMKASTRLGTGLRGAPPLFFATSTSRPVERQRGGPVYGVPAFGRDT